MNHNGLLWREAVAGGTSDALSGRGRASSCDRRADAGSGRNFCSWRRWRGRSVGAGGPVAPAVCGRFPVWWHAVQS
jgi:hypothetical protein